MNDNSTEQQRPQPGEPDTGFIEFAAQLQEKFLDILDNANSTEAEIAQAKRALRQISRDIRRALVNDASDSGNSDDEDEESAGITCAKCMENYNACTPYGSPTCYATYTNCLKTCTRCDP